jgi:hypothetical protein
MGKVRKGKKAPPGIGFDLAAAGWPVASSKCSHLLLSLPTLMIAL